MSDGAPSFSKGETIQQDVVAPLGISSETSRVVFLRNLRLHAYIGAYEHEQNAPQPVVIDIAIDVRQPKGDVDDDLSKVLCYDKIHQGVKRLLSENHINLVETLAERVCNFVLEHPMASAVTVSVEKPAAITAADGVGVRLRREKQ
ncbi:MAG: dihydroneopterin aldolase [Pseudomonadota bacterium]